jgi:hypothetical protein
MVRPAASPNQAGADLGLSESALFDDLSVVAPDAMQPLINLQEPGALSFNGPPATSDIHSAVTASQPPAGMGSPKRTLLIIFASLLGVLGGFSLLAFVVLPDLGQAIVGAVVGDASGGKTVVPVADADAGSAEVDAATRVDETPDKPDKPDKPDEVDAGAEQETLDAAAQVEATDGGPKDEKAGAPKERAGFLTITSKVPVLADIDGKPVGQTPLYNLKLSPGEHTVDLWANPVKPKRIKVTIHPDETTSLTE